MKKIYLLLSLLIICVSSLFAQAPEKFTYQAVVRNASNQLVINAQVGVRVNILQGSATGDAVYSESHVTSSNANGLVTVNIGGGSVLHGSFTGIDWSDGPYFLKTDIDPNGGNDYSITSTQQLLSVPYALYAKEAGNGFSGDYNDLTNTPQIPQIPADVSAFNNDAGYITAGQVPAQVNADWNATSGAAEILNKPTIPTVPTNVSAFTNDAGYITGYTETDPQFTAWDKDYNDLINKPAIPTVPTNVSAFTNDAGYITSAGIPAIPTVPTNVSAFTNDAGYITSAQVPAQVNADWNATTGAAQILNKPILFSGNYNDLTNKPTLFSGNYNDLTNKPTLFDGNYNSLTNRPNLAAVAISGSYNDLINKPSIPTAVGELTNNVGYITQAQVPAQVNADWNATSGAAQILNKPTLFSGNYNDLTNKPVLFSGDYNDLTNLPQIPQIPADISAFNNDAGYLTSYTETDPQFNAWDKNYNDLTNKPTIPTVPANVSAFTNDAGYLTGYTETDPQFNAWDKSYNDLTNKPVLFSGDYNDLANKPTIPTVPANVSAFTNDAGYLTSFTEQQVLSISNDTLFLTGGSFVKLPAGFDGDYNSLTNKPAIPTVPTNVSAFTNDAGYITAANVQEAANIPTNVSAFNNDAGYITSADIPEIPTVPTNVSAFTNDAGYLTEYIEQQVLSISNDTLFLTGGSFVKLPTGFDGDYNSLTNTPTIPTTVGELTNDANYITIEEVPAQVNADWNATEGAAQILNKPELFDGDYNSLTNTPTIPTVPTNVSAFTNDAGYITAANVQEVANIPTNVSAFNNDAGYITSADIPEIPTVPTNVSAFTNDAGYLTEYIEQQVLSISNDTLFLTGGSFVKLPAGFDGDYNSLTNTPTIPTTVGELTNDANYITIEEVPAQVNADWNATEGAAQILNKPELFDGNYNSLINKPNLATVATTGNYNDLVNKPILFSGNYNDLSNTPTIPTVNNATLTIQKNGGSVGTFSANASSNKTVNITVPTTTSELINTSGFITVANLPSVPTQVSELDNDAGYITQAQLNNANYIANTGDACGNTVDLCQLMNTIATLQNQVQELSSTVGVNPYGTVSDASCPTRMVVIEGNPNVCYYGPSYDNVILSAWLDGSIALDATYTWFKNGEQRPNSLGYDNHYMETWEPTYDNPYLFTVQITTNDGCVYTSAPFKVNVYDRPYVTISSAASEVCAGGEVSLRANLQNYNTPMITYQWYENQVNNNNILPARTHEVETFAPNMTTDYIVKVTHLMDYNTQYCIAYDTFHVEVSDCIPSDGESNCCSALSDAIDSLRGMITHLNYVIDTLTFHCGTSTVTDHEGNVYATVQIGNQCWMRDNLRTTTSPSTGTYLIPAANANFTYTGKQARWFNNDSATYAPMNYGLLYNWNAVVDTFNTAYGETSVNSSFTNAVSVTFSGHRRGICPAGWHLPSDAEWTAMTDYVSSQSEYQCGGNSSNIAKALASTEGWNTYTNNCVVGNDPSSNNATGFSAVPAGFCVGSSFDDAGDGAFFWSSTQYDSSYAYGRHLYYFDAGVYGYCNAKGSGFSVRCLRDETGGGGTVLTEPTVTTSGATDVTETSATLNGSVSNPDEVAIATQGFEWKATSGGAYVAVNATGETMTYNLTGLTAGTSYTYRAFVTTAAGTSYGEEVTFTTLSAGGTAVIDEKSCPAAPTVTDHEGNVYATVQIGNQCWMRDNLRTTTSPSTGTYLIPAAGTNYTLTGKQAFWYNNDSTAYAPMNYGLLYNWNAAVDTFNTAYGETSVNNSSGNAVSVTFTGHRRGICPAGWHLPSDTEWTAMTSYVSSQGEYLCDSNNNYIAKALADNTGWYSYSNTCAVGNDQSENNATGFSAVPAGFCFGSSFVSADKVAVLWSSSQYAEYPIRAYRRSLVYSYADVGRDNYFKYDGFSVRCLRDETGTVVIDEKSCPAAPTVTDHEGNVYATVQIGNQCWMRDNLRTTTSPSTGTYLIPAAGTGYTYTGKQAFWSNNDSATYAPMNYGLLYNWNAAVDTFNTAYGETSVNSNSSNAVSVTFTGHRRGICPAGWHLPSDAEWNTMEATVSGSDWLTSYETTTGWRGNHAGKLAGGDNWTSSTTSGAPGDYGNADRNVSGFSAVPAGYCSGPSFINAGFNAFFWSATQFASNPNLAYDRYLNFDDAYVNRNFNRKSNGRSVRCLRD